MFRSKLAEVGTGNGHPLPETLKVLPSTPQIKVDGHPLKEGHFTWKQCRKYNIVTVPLTINYKYICANIVDFKSFQSGYSYRSSSTIISTFILNIWQNMHFTDILIKHKIF